MSRSELFSHFITEAISEAAKTAIKAAVSTALPNAPLAGEFVVTVSKDFLDALLMHTSAVEKKLDVLLREPLKAGLRLLGESMRHPSTSEEEIRSRDALLDAAHVSFVRACALVEDSREDSIFVRALDCLSLIGRSGRAALARQALSELHHDLKLLQDRTQALKANADVWADDVRRINSYFGRDDFGGKPFGYDVQLIWVKSQEKQSAKVQREAQAAQVRLALLEDIAGLAEVAMQKQSPRHVNDL